ncbi:MAG: hypothetical protein GXO31_00385 [Epsilonproteobacteria bacterium]|nr:hypothetical protein [Campylobacterota bacterium]
MFKGLSLDQAPPYEAPLRFFLTAPFFAILGGALLFFVGYDVSSPQVLGLLHLFTLGFITLVMMGAMQQMLPVLVGVTFPNALFFAKIIHVSVIVGTLLFGFGLFFEQFSFLAAALVFLLFGVGIFSFITLYKLLKASHKSATVWAMILSVVSLIIALFLGSHLLASLGFGKVGESFSFVLPSHGIFAFFGWVGLLIVGVSYQVIPMFYVTKDFDENIKKYLSFFIFGSLVLSLFFKYAIILTVLGYIYFGLESLKLLESRKRKIKEITIDFWEMSVYSLVLAGALFVGDMFIGNEVLERIYSVLFVYGFVISLICGMLYKIVPFLAWFHISSRGFFDMPTMKEMIDERDLKIQFKFHTVSVLSLLILPKIAGIFIIASNIYLFLNLYKVLKIYTEYKAKPSPFDSFKKPA